MSETILPPGETTRVLARSALVVAPHADDEIIGCGGLLAQLAASGADVTVLYVSDSSGGTEVVSDPEAYARRRRDEAADGLAILGVDSARRLDLPDGSLDQHLDAIAAGVREVLLQLRPELLLAPSALEVTRDHRAVFTAVHRALSRVRPDDPLASVLAGLRVLLYEVNHLGYPDLLVDVSAEVELIDRALAQHTSQLELHDYRGAALAMRRYRTFPLRPGISAAEGYVDLRAVDFVTTSPAAMVERLGGRPDLQLIDDGPLLSVVVRTMDRPGLLAEALASVAASSYRRVEVVLVNDGGRPPEVPEGYPFRVVRVEHGTNRGRAAAANAGVAAATGALLTFLDDDDLMAPDHLATLAGLAAAADVRVAYTDAAVTILEAHPDGGWREVERRLPYSRDFDPELLLLDNYIPFNTLVFERDLLVEVGPLDEDLPFFEDWELLIRLSRRASFHHLRQVTCEYRHFRGGRHVFGERPAERDDFLTVKAQVVARSSEQLRPSLVSRVVARLRAEAIEHAESARGRGRDLGALRRSLAELEDAFHRVQGERASLAGERERLLGENHRLSADVRRLGDELSRLYDEEKRLHRDAAERGREVESLSAEVDRLSTLIRAMEATKAWRLHRLVERLRGRTTD